MQRLYPQAALAALLIPRAADAQDAYPATLAGHAILPAMSLIAAPHDDPADLKNAGKFTSGQRVDATHIVVGHDNNLPFSSSREPNRADDNERVLLEVGDFLKAL